MPKTMLVFKVPEESEELKDSGMTMVDIARKLGISRQRVYQILGKVKK